MVFIYPDTFRLLQLNLNDGFPIRSKRCFSRDCKNLYSRKCLITGQDETTVKLVSHHMYNIKDYPHLEYTILNAVCISTECHKEFHKLYGVYCSPEQFVMYLKLCKKMRPEIKVQNLDKLIDWVIFLDLEMKSRSLI